MHSKSQPCFFSKTFLVLLIVTLIFSCKKITDTRYEVSGSQVKIPLKGGTLLLNVYSDKIIRVRYVVGDSIPNDDSILVFKKCSGEFKVAEKDSLISIETAFVKAQVSPDGTVQFVNTNNQTLLSEMKNGRKLTPVNDHGKSSFSVQQTFLCGDEALYGLGQFQNGLFNWKNTPLVLKQYNQEIAVPFLMSSKGYGILWNNYSITQFNPAEKEVTLATTVDSARNIRKSSFIPAKSGTYNFAIEAPNAENRMHGPVLLTINGDTVFHYNTVWVPDFHVGRIDLEANRNYEVVLQNSNSQSPGKLVYNEPDYNKTVFQSQLGNAIDYFFIYGEDQAQLIHGMRDLTGTAPMFSKNIYGFWQCRERYYSQKELLDNAMEYRKRGIPVDNIVQDWNYWPEKTWGPEWDRTRYPDPKKMVASLDSLHMKLMVSIWPRIDNPVLEERYHLKEYKLDKGGNLDFYNPALRNNYYNMVKDSMYALGIHYIWLDGTEPEVYPANAITNQGSFDRVALTYSLMVTKSIYDRKREDYPQQRVFNLTRSAFLGQQKYGAAVWSGDVQASWEQFREQIPAGLNYSMAGLPYWTTDIGGFFRDSKSFNPQFKNQYTSDEFKELLTRWFQFGAFCPLFRIHGYVSETEVWRYGQYFETMARKFIELRYRLMPYLYAQAWKVTNSAGSIIAPPVYYYPNDKKTWELKDQFFYGPSILVAPITHYQARQRQVYLPAGGWYNFWTNEKLPGNQTVSVKSPLDQVPALIRQGSILPFGPALQYANEPSKEGLTLVVYPGANADFEWYDDEGENYTYEKGRHAVVPIHWDDQQRELSIGQRKGTFPGLQEAIKIKVVVVDSTSEGGLSVIKKPDTSLTYRGAAQKVNF